MKKLIAVFFLLLGAVIVLLATIDLKPFLAPEQAAITAVNKPPQVIKPAVPPITSEVAEKLPDSDRSDPEDPGNDPLPEPPLNEVYPEQEQVVMAHKTQAAAAGATQPAGIEAEPIELEVTTVPPADYPFSVLVGTFQKKETAQKAVSLYLQRGIATFWVKVDLEQRGVRYRQFSGFFSSMAEARQYLEQGELVDKLVKPTYYAALLGIFTEKNKLADAFVKAEQAGVMPYILGTQNGAYFLYVGAFYTHIGAVDQCRELNAAGLNCEPVKRSTKREKVAAQMPLL